MNCLVCNKRQVPQGYTTCGASICQEIRFLQQLLHNKRRRTKAERQEIVERLNELESLL